MKSSQPEVKHAIVRFTWTLEILLTDWKYWVQTRRLCIHNCGKIFTFLLSSTCTFYQFILLLKFWTPLNHIATFKRKPNYLHFYIYHLNWELWISKKKNFGNMFGNYFSMRLYRSNLKLSMFCITQALIIGRVIYKDLFLFVMCAEFFLKVIINCQYVNRAFQSICTCKWLWFYRKIDDFKV